MEHTRGFYSVVQYLPDPFRSEAANVGALLFVPSTGELVVRMSPTLARVKRFFDPSKDDFTRVQIAVAALKSRFQRCDGEFANEEDLARFAAARADAVRITAPRLWMVGDLAADLDTLYKEAVGDAEPAAKKAANPLPPRLAEVFERLRAAGRVWRPGTVTVPTDGRKFKVAAAYQNGVTNFVRAESLAHERTDKLERLGYNGRLISTHKIDGEAAQLVVVSADPAVKADIEARFEKTLVDFGVKFVRYAAADDYAAEVEQTAH